MLTNLFLGQTAEEKNFIEDLFSCYLYTGNGSTQTITNGIDLAGKGGMVWVKNRATGSTSNIIADTIRGAGGGSSSSFNKLLSSNSTAAEGLGISSDYIGSALSPGFRYDGFLVSYGGNGFSNNNNSSYASWTFRKAPKFFDIVTFSPVGSGGATFNHSLGVVPGMIIVKRTDAASNWFVWHRGSGSGTSGLSINSTSAATWNNVGVVHTSSQFQTNYIIDHLSNFPDVAGATYVAYLFAHDTTADGVIQCGSFTGATTVSLGWEPQYLLIKKTDAAGNWITLDNMRGMPVIASSTGSQQVLFSNLSNAESVDGVASPNATGFTTFAGGTYIYLAIRRGPMRVPTDATKVFSPIARSGTGATAVVSTGSVIPDMSIVQNRGGTYGGVIADRLRGAARASISYATDAELDNTNVFSSFGQLDITLGGSVFTNGSTSTYAMSAFSRAPGFFDVNCFTGANSSNQRVNHNLGVTPELIILKSRTLNGSSWCVYAQPLGLNKTLFLNQNSASLTYTVFYTPSSTDYGVDVAGAVGDVGGKIVSYLFASCPGVSKVGYYTGNGSSLNVDCGFTNGARFVLIKRTDSTGDWYTFDTARGIVTGDDPHLSLNTTAAEVTTNDSIDPLSSGFTVNQIAATNINVNAATYIYLAIA